jgi:hypothetical protein
MTNLQKLALNIWEKIHKLVQKLNTRSQYRKKSFKLKTLGGGGGQKRKKINSWKRKRKEKFKSI